VTTARAMRVARRVGELTRTECRVVRAQAAPDGQLIGARGSAEPPSRARRSRRVGSRGRGR
jgi:hypothetical protein